MVWWNKWFFNFRSDKKYPNWCYFTATTNLTNLFDDKFQSEKYKRTQQGNLPPPDLPLIFLLRSLETPFYLLETVLQQSGFLCSSFWTTALFWSRNWKFNIFFVLSTNCPCCVNTKAIIWWLAEEWGDLRKSATTATRAVVARTISVRWSPPFPPEDDIDLSHDLNIPHICHFCYTSKIFGE